MGEGEEKAPGTDKEPVPVPVLVRKTVLVNCVFLGVLSIQGVRLGFALITPTLRLCFDVKEGGFEEEKNGVVVVEGADAIDPVEIANDPTAGAIPPIPALEPEIFEFDVKADPLIEELEVDEG